MNIDHLVEKRLTGNQYVLLYLLSNRNITTYQKYANVLKSLDLPILTDVEINDLVDKKLIELVDGKKNKVNKRE